MTCPRCAGLLYQDEDYAGRFLSCINCGELIPLDGYDPTDRLPSAPRGRNYSGSLKGMTVGQRHPRR